MGEKQVPRRRVLPLRTKVTLCVAVVLTPLVVLAALLRIQEVRQDYMETVEWHSLALAQQLQHRVADLSGYAPSMQRTLGLNVDCKVLLEANRADGLVHVGVIGADGRVIAHTDATLLNQVEHFDRVQRISRGSGNLTILSPTAYDTLIPVSTTEDALPVAVIDIGFSREVIDLRTRDTIVYTGVFILACLVLSFLLISILLKRFVTQPISDLSKAAAALARTSHGTGAGIDGSDEVALLADSFERMRNAIQQQLTDLNREINDRKRSEEALRESEQKHREFTENLPQRIFHKDRNLVYVSCNKHYAEDLGIAPDDIAGKSDFDFYPSELAEKYRADDRKVMESRQTADIEESYIRDGQEFTVQTVKTPLTGSAGNVTGILGIFWDITDRKRAEQERNELEAQLRHSQKLEAVGQLAGGVAHDFNNLLQAISGYGEMAREEAGTDGPVSASVDQMLIAADRAATLVGQLLAFSRRQVLEMKDVDLNETIADLLKMLRRVIGEHIDMNVLSGHNLGVVRADAGQIGQILMNLCVNARDAMPGGGTVTIETEEVRIDEAYCEIHTWATPGRYVLLSVTDTGCGMDQETLGKIFDPFFTTKGLGEGTGLGLSTVYGLVKQHSGLIHVYSEVEVGTTFKIYLPVTERRATVVGAKAEGPVVGGTETILLAEDDPAVRQLTRTILERAGYTVLAASDGEEALAVFEEHAEEIDLALLDVMMPKLGGRFVSEQIRERRPEVRILFSSGYSMNAIHTNFVLDEGLALIQKPAQRSDLLRKIRQVLDDEQETKVENT